MTMNKTNTLYLPIAVMLLGATADVDVSLMRARAKAAVEVAAVSVVQHVSDVPKKDTTPVPPKVAKPVVFVEYASFGCPPCEQMKRQSWVDAPFKLKPGTAQIPAQHYPWVHWQDSVGKWRYLESWGGKQDLIQRWELTQEPKPVANPLAGNHPTVGVKGMTMEYHLRVDHGIDTRGLTAAELQKAHDAVHAGISVQRINDYIASERRRQGR